VSAELVAVVADDDHGHANDERNTMGIGFSIFLLAVGAILAFAVHATVAGVDIHVVGWILMAAGALGLILTMIVFAPRRRRTVTETRSVAAEGSKTAPPRNVVEREVRDDGI
jgi:hypothetical protein